MQIRPLHRFIMLDFKPLEVGEVRGYVPIYGDHSYLTKNNGFIIKREDGQWCISERKATVAADMAAAAAGLYDIQFPRRRDAIEALEHVLEDIE